MLPLPRRAVLLALLALLASGAAEDEIPRGRLPAGVRPVHYALELEIVPEREDFRGRGRIGVELAEPLSTLWLHGRDLEVERAEVVPAGGSAIEARWEQHTEDGVAALHLDQPVGPGRVVLELDWRAPFDRTLRGLYRVESGGAAYAFTQFEPISARRAFPGFDEPAFKTPFDVTLVVPAGQTAIASTPAEAEEPAGDGLRRIRFATTPKLPTYLLAWAVGPLDVVEAPDLAPAGPRARAVPFRGVAARGRGERLAYALDHTPALLADLESYFGSPYPYAKLDVIAVPDFGAGAMENVGAITFRESLLLLDPSQAPEQQRRSFAYVMAHELAHQWFGNLVTMHWWDDLWLNEAFASWLGSRTIERVHPENHAEMISLQHVHGAMDADSLESGRSIRQPVESHHDIRNAFDAITYSKGGGVLGMFERWLGEETFRAGIQRYIASHRDGSARAEDLMAALGEVSGRDVATPFRTFLEQPGVPLVEMALRCDAERTGLALRQSRYLPVGSTGDRAGSWQIPLCVRVGGSEGVGELCALLAGPAGWLPLDACPDWVMPNAAGAGYYRFAQPAEQSQRLLALAGAELSAAERLALADSLGAALRAAATPAAGIFAVLPGLADDPHRAVATAPMELLTLAREHLADDATRSAVEQLGRELYAPRLASLGWEAAPGESGETRLLRQQLVGFLALVARDPAVRREAARRARQYLGLEGPPRSDALEPELVETALSVLAQEGGPEIFDRLEAQLLASEDALERGQRLHALGRVTDPELAARTRRLSLDPRLRVNEVMMPLWTLTARRETRDATWSWLVEHFDALAQRLGGPRAGSLPHLAGSFCSEARAAEVEAFFAPRIEPLEGGPRNLAIALERIRLCAALVEAQAASTRAFFGSAGIEAGG